MNISLNIDGRYTNIFNIYALAEGKSIANAWMYKKLHPVLDESRRHDWKVIVGGDFNQKAGPLDGRPGRAHPFTINPGLYHLLNGDCKLIDSFRYIHSTTRKYSFLRSASAKPKADAPPLEQLNTTCLTNLLTFLSPCDVHGLLAASSLLRRKLRGKVFSQSRIDLLLIDQSLPIIHADIANNAPVDSDHSPILVAISLTSPTAPNPTVTASTQAFRSALLLDPYVKAKLQANFNAVYSPTALTTAAQTISHLMEAAAQACTLTIPLPRRPNSGEGAERGLLNRYRNKALRVYRHVTCCLANNMDITATRPMLQLADAPEWARCPLPPSWNRENASVYALAAKSKAKTLTRSLLSSRSSAQCAATNKAVAEAASKGGRLGPLWRTLASGFATKHTQGVAVVCNGVTQVYRNKDTIVTEFGKYWAQLFSAGTKHERSRTWFDHAHPPIPVQDVLALTAPISDEEFYKVLSGLKQGLPGMDHIDAAIL
jgi:hypothetical protein